jgi:hypothetical protein
LFSPFHTDAALKRIEKNKKCDEQVIIVDEQARGVEIEGEFTTEDTENTEERFRQNRSGAEKDCGRQPEG